MGDSENLKGATPEEARAMVARHFAKAQEFKGINLEKLNQNKNLKRFAVMNALPKHLGGFAAQNKTLKEVPYRDVVQKAHQMMEPLWKRIVKEAENVTPRSEKILTAQHIWQICGELNQQRATPFDEEELKKTYNFLILSLAGLVKDNPDLSAQGSTRGR